MTHTRKPQINPRDIPALTLSGGKLSEFGGVDSVVEYRVWNSEKNGGADNYYSFTSVLKAKKFSDSFNKTKKGHADEPIAVVWDTKHNNFREVVID